MNKLEVQNIDKELQKLENLGGIVGNAIVKRNGLLISSKLPRDIDERKFGAMAATMYGAIETAVSTLKRNQINYLTVEFNEFQLIILEINENIIIVSLMDSNIDLGLTLIEIEESIKNINKIINK